MSAPADGAPRVFVIRLAATLAVVAVAVLAVTQFVARPWVVSGPSMEPTLRDGDRVLVELWTLRRRAPQPREVVLLEGPAPAGKLVKRVVGDPHPGPELGSSLYVVLGDNSAESLDSRSFGAVGRERILGRVVFRYWPLDRAGRIE